MVTPSSMFVVYAHPRTPEADALAGVCVRFEWGLGFGRGERAVAATGNAMEQCTWARRSGDEAGDWPRVCGRARLRPRETDTHAGRFGPNRCKRVWLQNETLNPQSRKIDSTIS